MPYNYIINRFCGDKSFAHSDLSCFSPGSIKPDKTRKKYFSWFSADTIHDFSHDGGGNVFSPPPSPGNL